MAWLRKKADPISNRTRVLNDEIASLEAQIKKLDDRLQRQAQPRETGATITSAASSRPDRKPRAEPVFEPLDLGRLQQPEGRESAPGHFNELGVRKYDLPGLMRRVKAQFQGPSTTNPKLVSYLAAGGIQGLRPLRYEKRVARNRFIALVLFLFVVLVGLLLVFVRR